MLALASIMIAMLLVQALGTACLGEEDHQVRFIIFGSMKCPYCRSLKERLTSMYGENAVDFRNVEEPDNGRRLETLYSIIYPRKGEIGIPLTIIVVNGEPAGSVIGAMDDEFWRWMISETLLRTGEFLVYDEGALYAAKKDSAIMGVISELIGPSPSNASAIVAGSMAAALSSPTPVATHVVATTGRDHGAANYAIMAVAAAILAAIIVSRLRRRG